MAGKVKRDMSEVLEQQNQTEKPELSIVEPIPEAHNQRSPSRRGKKMSAVYLNKDGHQQLKILCIELGISIEDFIKDAINMKCQLHNRPPLA